MFGAYNAVRAPVWAPAYHVPLGTPHMTRAGTAAPQRRRLPSERRLRLTKTELFRLEHELNSRRPYSAPSISNSGTVQAPQRAGAQTLQLRAGAQAPQLRSMQPSTVGHPRLRSPTGGTRSCSCLRPKTVAPSAPPGASVNTDDIRPSSSSFPPAVPASYGLQMSLSTKPRCDGDSEPTLLALSPPSSFLPIATSAPRARCATLSRPSSVPALHYQQERQRLSKAQWLLRRQACVHLHFIPPPLGTQPSSSRRLPHCALQRTISSRFG